MQTFIKKRTDVFTIAIAIGIWFAYTFLYPYRGTDWLESFKPASNGNFQHVVVPYWGLFTSWIPAQLAEPFGFGLWVGLGMFLVILGARYLNAPLLLLVTSYQFHWVVFSGQIDSYVIFGIIFGIWAVWNSKPYLLGVALMMALIKPQISLLPALILFWWSVD